MTVKRSLWMVAMIGMVSCVVLAPLDGQEEKRPEGAATPGLEVQVQTLAASLPQLTRMRKLDEALQVWGRIVTLEQQLLGKQHQDIADSLSGIADLWERKDVMKNAIRFRQDALAMCVAVATHPDHWSIHDARRELERAKQLAALSETERKAVQEARHALQEVIPLRNTDNVVVAIELARQALKTLQETLGEDHVDCGVARFYLGMALLANSDHDSAYQQGLQSQQILQTHLHPHHRRIEQSWLLLSAVMWQLRQEYAQAIVFRQRALDVAVARTGEMTFDVAYHHDQIGGLYRRLFDIRGAASSYRDALRIYDQVLGEDSLPSARTALLLGNQLIDEQPLDAIAYLRRSQAALREMPRQQGLYFSALGSYASALNSSGSTANARNVVMKAVAFFEASEPESEDMAACLSTLGSAASSLGDKEVALKSLERSVAIREKLFGPTHPKTGRSYSSFGDVLDQFGEKTRAISYYERSLNAFAQFSETNTSYFTTLHNLAVVQLAVNSDKALERFDRSITLAEKSLGPDHPRLVSMYCNYGEALYLNSRLDEALETMQRALQVARKNTRGDRVLWTACCGNGELLAAVGRHQEAQTLFYEACDAGREFALTEIPLISEVEAVKYLEWQKLDLHRILANARRLDGVRPADVYGRLWQNRGLLMREVVARRRRLMLDDAAQDVLYQLYQVCRQVSALVYASGEANDPKLKTLLRKKQGLERQLGEHDMRLLRSQEVARQDAADMMRALPADTALVEFFRVGSASAKKDLTLEIIGRPRYQAFVITARQDDEFNVAWLEIGSAADLEPLIDRLNARFQNRGDRGLRPRPRPPAETKAAPAAMLRKAVWEKIEPHFKGRKKVVIIPDERFCLIPWAALPGAQPDTYLIEDYSLSTVSNGQQLLELATREAVSGNRLLAVGDVDYDASDEEPVSPPAKAVSAVRSGLFPATMRSEFARLQNTRSEVQIIAAQWKERGPSTLLFQHQPSEQRLRAEMPTARYIHLATHGFFLGDDQGEAQQSPRFQRVSQRRSLLGGHPMLLCGLAMRGANVPPRLNDLGEPVGDDGVLTAEEVLGLNLSNTELVVLSACESGLGRVANGEVFGLQRAFSMAGARSVVGSLWQVDDQATQALMIRFYENLWTAGQSKAEALRNAQLAAMRLELLPAEVRERLQDEGVKRLPPAYWAAWMLYGDWR